MIKQTYVSALKKEAFKDTDVKVFVNNRTFLAPSKDLKVQFGVQVNDDGTKKERGSFPDYGLLYLKELLGDHEKLERLRYYKIKSKLCNVWFICYCKNYKNCHRRIIIELLDAMRDGHICEICANYGKRCKTGCTRNDEGYISTCLGFEEVDFKLANDYVLRRGNFFIKNPFQIIERLRAEAKT